MIGGIVLVVFGLLVVLVSWAAREDKVLVKVLSIYGAIFTLMGGVFIGKAIGMKSAYKESLKGNNPYKIEISYQLVDSLYVPVDTTYVLAD